MRNEKWPVARDDANRRQVRALKTEGGLAGFIVGFFGSLFFALFFIGAGGFFEFVAQLPKAAAEDVDGDAIVVLTGGEDRINQGLSLLANGQGQRLLISGVHAQTTHEDIRELIEPALATHFDCCVDLDHAAQNTIGNAVEAAKWVNDNGYDTIIVVTAFYHMPRSMAELREALPKTKLVAYPVFPPGVDLNGYWKRPATTKLLVSEYVKYVAALVRFRLNVT